MPLVNSPGPEQEIGSQFFWWCWQLVAGDDGRQRLFARGCTRVANPGWRGEGLPPNVSGFPSPIPDLWRKLGSLSFDTPRGPGACTVVWCCRDLGHRKSTRKPCSPSKFGSTFAGWQATESNESVPKNCMTPVGNTYNYNVSAQFKPWIDAVVKAGVSFNQKVP